MQTKTVTQKEITDILYRLLGQLDCYVTMHKYPSTIEAVRDAEIVLNRMRTYGIGQRVPVEGSIGGAA